jgi:AraC-like DNA-binding protein
MVDPQEPSVLNVSDVVEIGYREVPPHPALAPFVECLWAAGKKELRTADDRRILPDGRMDLVWIRGAGVLVAGPQTRFTVRTVPAPLVAVGVRFHPGVAPGLLRLPAADFVDGHVALAAVDSALAARLEPALDSSRTLGGAFEAFNRELLRQVDRLAQRDVAVTEAADILASDASVADVSSRVHVSERQLRRRFAERVGYGPKTLQRVLRFQRLVGMLGEPESELARVAVEAGYSDQAHLARECRELSGLTPTELAAWLRA